MELSKMSNRLFAKKLLGTTDQFDEQEFHNKIEGDAHALSEFRFMQRVWQEAEHVKVFEQIDPDKDWKFVNDRIGNRLQAKYKRVPWGVYFLRIAAIFVLSGGLSIGFYKILTVQKPASAGFTSYNTDDYRQDFILPDGSTVTLKKGSQLTFRDGFGSISRDVILDGEAFFNVVPGSDLPFKVFSGESVVEVTGTKFSVYEIDGNIHVSVVSGTVLLSATTSSEKKITIEANQSGYLLTDNELKVEEGIPANALSWKTGHLVFDQTPIDSALIDIAHHFNKELSLESALHDKISAEFQDQPLHEILDEIKLVAGLQFDTTGTALIVRK